jgi:URI fold toxin 2
MAKKIHANSHENLDLHFLYEILDNLRQDTYKYGISSDELKAGNTSEYLEKQLKMLNSAAEMDRYDAEILLRDIIGRLKAKQIEDKYMLRYEALFGRLPRGNQTLNFPNESREKFEQNSDENNEK